MEIVSTAVLVPLAVGATVVGILPPSGGAILRGGKANGLISFQTGVGFGERVDLKRFSDVRFLLSYTHIYGGNYKDFVRLEGTGDLHLFYLDRRRIFLVGASPTLGMITDFPSVGYSAGASAWVMTPWLAFFGFIPQHTFGVSYRYNAYVGGTAFGEVSAEISSAFTWGW
ncbi:MAG TPA: hypothetical protein VMG34_09905 [Bacteroidota bacterium]|nr:hypothetical protein [Bacteroidota bacterium]